MRTLKWAFGKKKKANPEDQPKRSDDVHINVFKLEDEEIAPKDSKKKKERISLAQGSGNWLSHVRFDEEITWRIQDEIPQWMDRGEKMSDGTCILPSDTDNRGDIEHMLAKNWPEAEKVKSAMEQR